jgi:flagellar biosynthesis component FlhA
MIEGLVFLLFAPVLVVGAGLVWLALNIALTRWCLGR